MDELGIAKAIQAGDLISPQRYRNISLFALRITGTGTSFRPKLDEYVYRNPDHYLCAEFLERCAGLPVIYKHPKTNELDSKEFGERVVGSIMSAYIVGDEVWGIARIYDDDVIKIMSTTQMSTSPAVVLKRGDNAKMVVEGLGTLLVEGKPALLDHLAICERGVWDKGDDPTGVLSQAIGDSVMADEKKKEGTIEQLDSQGMVDKLLKHFDDAMGKHCDALSKRMDSRMDAFEEKYKKDSKKDDDDDDDDSKKDAAKKDAESEEKKALEQEKKEEKEAVADKKRKDNAEPETEKEKAREVVADKKRKDDDDTSKRKDESEKEKENEDAKGDSIDVRLARVERQSREMTDEDYRARAAVQEKLDRAFRAFGDEAPRPLNGELAGEYKLRVLAKLQKHSVKWKTMNLAGLNDAIDVAMDDIVADSIAAAERPTDLGFGELREVKKRVNGREISEFFGPNSFIVQSKRPVRFVTGFKPNTNT